VIHGFRNQQNAPAKNYNCNAKASFEVTATVVFKLLMLPPAAPTMAA